MMSARLSAPIVALINHVLDQAGWARQKLQPFAGRNVSIAMTPFSLSFIIGNDGRLQNHFQGSGVPADLEIVLPASTPLLALQGSEQLMKAVQINGPADLADALSFVLRHLRWDIEEDLAKVFGDIAAHRMAGALNAFVEWQRKAAINLAENVSEYFVEENPTLVKPAEMAAFVAEVAQLCEQLATIESSISRLK
jgi:ubiquinone biosynthesis accessory factor UbiJ